MSWCEAATDLGPPNWNRGLYKAVCKVELYRELGLAVASTTPLVIWLSRITNQKADVAPGRRSISFWCVISTRYISTLAD